MSATNINLLVNSTNNREFDQPKQAGLWAKPSEDWYATFGTKNKAPLATALHSSANTISISDDDTPPYNLCFPQRLYKMLNKIDEKQQQFSKIISWHATGMGFVLHDPKAFEHQVMPVFFRSQSKLPSFRRQLNNYGFQRVEERNNSNNGSMTYYHRFFLREAPGLCHNIILKSKTFSKKSRALSTRTAIITDSNMTKEVRQALLLKIAFQRQLTKTNALMKNSNVFATTRNIVPPDSPCSTSMEGDTILDEAVTEVCGPAESLNHDFFNTVASTIGTTNDRVLGVVDFVTTICWDPDVEALDNEEEV